MNPTLKKSEKQVVASCKAYFKHNGWVCKTLYTGGIPIGFGKMATNSAKGIPDMIVFHESSQLFLWVEYKKSHGGVLSAEQLEFHRLLRICGQIVIVVNSLDSLKKQLAQIYKDNMVAKLKFKPEYLE